MRLLGRGWKRRANAEVRRRWAVTVEFVGEATSHCSNKPAGEPVVIMLPVAGPISYSLWVSEATLEARVED